MTANGTNEDNTLLCFINPYVTLFVMKIYEYEMIPRLVSETATELEGNTAAKIVEYMKGAFDERPEQESIYVVFLNRKSKIIGRYLATIGTQTSALASPSLILRSVILASATSFVMVHNHPSGDPCPSLQDMQITRLMREAAKACDLLFIDHVIIGDPISDPLHAGFYSFRNAGMI